MLYSQKCAIFKPVGRIWFALAFINRNALVTWRIVRILVRIEVISELRTSAQTMLGSIPDS